MACEEWEIQRYSRRKGCGEILPALMSQTIFSCSLAGKKKKLINKCNQTILFSKTFGVMKYVIKLVHAVK